MRRAQIGVVAQQTATARAVADRAHLTATSGARAMEIQAGSPADAAGVRNGDIIIRIEGEAISRVDDLSRLLDDSRIGQSFDIGLLSGDQPLSVSITPVEREQRQLAS